MFSKSQIDIAAPTPFGWVLTTQEGFDLSSAIAFRSQLLSLAEACTKGQKVEIGEEATSEVLSNPK